jgi:uncharacterized protein
MRNADKDQVMDRRCIYSRRKLFQTAALLLAATATPSFACATMGSNFGSAHHRFFNAAKKGDIAAMQVILQSGEVETSGVYDGSTWLQWTIIDSQPRAMASLLKVGARPEEPDEGGGNTVLDAAVHKNPKWLKILLAHGANPSARHSLNGTTPLRAALISNRDKQFAMLVEAKADLTSTDAVGNTPLHVAGQINKPWHAMSLLMAGADPLARNAQGETFQRYLFMSRDSLLSRTTRKGRQAVLDYLWFKEIPIEPGAPPRENEGRQFRG